MMLQDQKESIEIQYLQTLQVTAKEQNHYGHYCQKNSCSGIALLKMMDSPGILSSIHSQSFSFSNVATGHHPESEMPCINSYRCNEKHSAEASWARSLAATLSS